MIKVNAIGDVCPIPVVKTKKAMQELNGAGTIEVLVDNEIAVTNVTKMASAAGGNVTSEKLAEKEYKIVIEVSGENVITRIEGFGEVCMSAPTNDWNTACGTRSGFYMGADMSNSPSGDTVANWWWVIHLAHNENYQRQIAFSFLNNNGIYTRIKNNGTWGSWSQV